MIDDAKQALDRVAHGNPDALRFARAWYHWCHAIDDLLDGDQDVRLDELQAVLVNFIVELAGNPFFIANRGYLTGLMVQSVNAWIDSNRIDGEVTATIPNGATVRDVLKGQWHEVIYGVAFLTGGAAGLARLTKAERIVSFDFEKDNPAPSAMAIPGAPTTLQGAT